jgi:hypothetical protein
MIANFNQSWIVTLVILTVVFGVVLGVSITRNIDGVATGTSVPSAAATPPAGTAQPASAAPLPIGVPQIDPAAVDRMLYPFRGVLTLAQRFADLGERQNQIAAERIAVEGREKELALQRSIEQQKAGQFMDLQHTLAMVAAGASVILVMALAASLIIYALLAGWGRLGLARARAAQLALQTQAAALDAKPSEQQAQWKAIWRTVGDLTRQQTNLKNEVDSMRRAAGNTPPAEPSQRGYDDLPLAV